MPAKHGLGRGLSALIKEGTAAEQPPATAVAGILKVQIDRIRKNTLQPRQIFDQAALSELADSIKQRGVLQPLLVRSSPSGYELIAGERRLRAAITAGLSEVPVIVMNVADDESLEMALVENIQREDLNPLEESEAYQTLANKFTLTQEQIAERVGKARVTITNSLRLLSLPPEIKQWIANGELSAGHAKALLGLEIAEEQTLLGRRAVKESLSVRNLEKLVQKAQKTPRKPRASREDIPPAHLKTISDKLHHYFGTSVRLTPSKTYANGKKAKGLIEIDFFSNDDLTRILEILGVSLE